jgi:hypothetical protein
MVKVTKKALIEEALKKYSSWKIEEAIYCNVIVTTRDWNRWELHFQLTNRWKKSKTDKIRTEIRSLLLNIKPDESNKRHDWDTSSENIESIKISLKFK